PRLARLPFRNHSALAAAGRGTADRWPGRAAIGPSGPTASRDAATGGAGRSGGTAGGAGHARGGARGRCGATQRGLHFGGAADPETARSGTVPRSAIHARI